MFDLSEKWWNKDVRISDEDRTLDHSNDCDCIVCKLQQLESNFHEITKQIREYLEK
jgi:hypothetical protein